MPIIVHNGRAHADDFLATCVCLFKLKQKAFRNKCTDEMLLNSDFWVLDQGGKHEPELHNFDHHHLDREICSFTMILDYFYGEAYREYMPEFRFIEIHDSYGSEKASEFSKQDPIKSPIQSALLKVFSKIEGEVVDPLLSVMVLIGEEICLKIEKMDILLKILDTCANFFEYKGIKILDVTKCSSSDFTHDQLPTKIWSKIKKINPTVILTIDSRSDSFRMISVNTNSVKFLPNDMANFTHISGFLTNFKEYSDFYNILDKFTIKNVK